MGARRTKIIAVDEKFFNTIFEKQRKKLQSQLGITNLSQPNFTKMIRGFKMTPLKKNIIKPNIKRGKKRNDFFKI